MVHIPVFDRMIVRKFCAFYIANIANILFMNILLTLHSMSVTHYFKKVILTKKGIKVILPLLVPLLPPICAFIPPIFLFAILISYFCQIPKYLPISKLIFLRSNVAPHITLFNTWTSFYIWKSQSLRYNTQFFCHDGMIYITTFSRLIQFGMYILWSSTGHNYGSNKTLNSNLKALYM